MDTLNRRPFIAEALPLGRLAETTGRPKALLLR